MDAPDPAPAANVGDIIKVVWPHDDNTTEKFACEVISVKKRNSEKDGSLFTYVLQNMKDPTDIRKTRLLNMNFKIKEYASKQTSSQALSGLHKLPDYSLILAPMVGGSELPFRLLCRKYGATLAYTPMMNADRFVADEEYRKEQFQTAPMDRPLVAHFAANNPALLLAAAKLVEHDCDAIDLNLGCPQRIAHAGHFGSFLLDDEDRDLVLSIVKTVSSGISIPMFIKIRLLETVDKTITFCKQLIASGASLIAIHARHRVSLVGRSGPTARDGPALLDQVQQIKSALREENVPIIANGNVITWADVVNNREFTRADGIMSAEGILDDPALFFDSLTVNSHKRQKLVKPLPSSLAKEYLDLVGTYPVTLKCCIFHIRRMLKKELTNYQLLENCLDAKSIEEVQAIVERIVEYDRQGTFVASQEKILKAKEIMERKKREEGKRKDYEARMMRKAKREGKPLEFYLKVGVDVPTIDELTRLKSLSKEESFEVWKKQYGQHCYAYHFESGRCPRERSCAFLHMDADYSEPVFG